MDLECITIGSFQTNCYLLTPDGAGRRDAIVVDTGLDPHGMARHLLARHVRPSLILLTHGHVDHIGGVCGLRQQFPDVKVCIHRLDAGMLVDTQANLSDLTGIDLDGVSADVLLEDGQIIEQPGIRLKVLHTPGHTPGGISLYVSDERIVFTGDALFAGSVGRTDLPGGDYGQLIGSIRTRLLSLPDHTKVYPGHGPATTIGMERRRNPFLAC